MNSFNFSGFTRRPRRSRRLGAETDAGLPGTEWQDAPQPAGEQMPPSKARSRRSQAASSGRAAPGVRHASDAVRANANPETPRRARGRRATGRPPSSTRRTTAAPPPVLVRTDWVNAPRPGSPDYRQPVQPRSQKTPRRRYDMALTVPGAEVRLPALPTLRVGWRLVSGLLVITLLGLLSYLWSSSDYQVVAVETEGLQRLTSTDIETVLGLSGQSIFTIDPVELRQELVEAFPELLTVSVKVGLPAQVVVSALERQPLIAWEQDGSQTWIDAEGIGFAPRGEAGGLITVQASALPPQTLSPNSASDDGEAAQAEASLTKVGFAPSAMLSADLIVAIQIMAADAPQGTVILYDPEHGLGWLDARGWQAFFGLELANIKDKLLVYKALVDRLQQDSLQPVLVSVEHLHAPFYRLEH